LAAARSGRRHDHRAIRRCVIGFEHETDARRFWDAMRVRFEELVLSL